MRVLFKSLLLFTTACTPLWPPTPPLTSIEGANDVLVVQMREASSYDAIVRDEVPRLRRLAGNQAVYVVRREQNLWVISVWDDAASAQRCHEQGLCGDDGFDVLFLTTQ